MFFPPPRRTSGLQECVSRRDNSQLGYEPLSATVPSRPPTTVTSDTSPEGAHRYQLRMEWVKSRLPHRPFLRGSFFLFSGHFFCINRSPPRRFGGVPLLFLKGQPYSVSSSSLKMIPPVFFLFFPFFPPFSSCRLRLFCSRVLFSGD